MSQLALSILTPAIPERFGRLEALCAELTRQIGDLPVEHLVLLDNCRRSIGRKRDALLRAARGRYVAFVDDDDTVTTNYIGEILSATAKNPDVITFRQAAIVDGVRSEIEFRLGNPNEPFQPDGTTKRNAWHVCAWRTALAISSGFPDNNYGEDWAYAAPLCALPNLKEIHIPDVLHYYTFDSKVSRAKQ